MKDIITIDNVEINTQDIMNPLGMFHQGQRMQQLSAKHILPLSGKLTPEFDRRQSIRDMFKRKPTLSNEHSLETANQSETSSAILSSSNAIHDEVESPTSEAKVVDYDVYKLLLTPKRPGPAHRGTTSALDTGKRQPQGKESNGSSKRIKLVSTTPVGSKQMKGQQILSGFFKPNSSEATSPANVPITKESSTDVSSSGLVPTSAGLEANRSMAESPLHRSNGLDPLAVHDPIESKESWSKLFSKPVAPRCEGHNEPCISLVTKKSGINCGRSFWMCPRPLGPSGAKERGTQWRCQSFVWCSDWNHSEK